MDDNRARWRGRRGRYEVWFLTLSAPDGRAGYWIRGTLRAPVAGPPERRVWFARFDGRDPGATFGINAAVPGAVRRDAPFSDSGAVFEPGVAQGRISGAGHDVRWDLRWTSRDAAFRVLPPLLYRPGLVQTRPFSPAPDVRPTGTIEVDGERVDAEGLAGHQGHLEGTRHAERWAWAQCGSFAEGYAFQALSAQARRAGVLTPFLTFGGIRVDDRWVRLRGTSRRRTWGLGTWHLQLQSKSFRLEGEVTAARDRLLRARYVDPDDTPRWCHNSEVASSRLLLWERRAGGWQELAALVSDGTTHAEWAGRTPAPGIDRVHEEVA